MSNMRLANIKNMNAKKSNQAKGGLREDLEDNSLLSVILLLLT